MSLRLSACAAAATPCARSSRAGVAPRQCLQHQQQQRPLQAAVAATQRQQRWRRHRAAAGRGGGPGKDSDSDEEDFFMKDGSMDQAFALEEEEYLDLEEADTSIRLYLDSAAVKEWETWAETGLFYGFTTNPTILKRDGVSCNIAAMRALAKEAFKFEAQELQLQAWGLTAAEMAACGLDLMDLDSRIVVKLPITLEGAKAAKKLVADGVPVTMTGVYAQHQVVSALALGAAYAAPYVGRMTDAGKNGLEEAIKMQSIVDLGSGEDDPMRLLVASIRTADEVAALAAEGINTMTFSPAVAAQMFDVKLTNDAAATFQQHADEMGACRGH